MRKPYLYVLLLVNFLSLSAMAASFTEGEHYVKVEGLQTEKQQVREFFSFYCPACYRQEPFMAQLASALPEGVSFVKNPVEGMPGRDAKVEGMLTKALVTASQLKVEKRLVAAIFDQIHTQKAQINSEEDLRSLFTLHGIGEDAFDKAFSSFSVTMKAKQMQHNTMVLREQGHSSVPTLIVNGRYMPVTRNLSSADEYRELILFLLKKTD